MKNNKTITFTPYRSIEEKNSSYSSSHYYPTIYSYQDKFVITFVPYDKGMVTGGRILVLKVEEEL